MFTGIITHLGTVQKITPTKYGREFDFSIPQLQLKPGASLAVNGACMTITKRKGAVHTVMVMPESLRVTNLGDLKVGSNVNLELPLVHGQRLDGHFVLGHVDAVGTVRAFTKDKKGAILKFIFPIKFQRYIVRKGSLALDGVSLTIASCGRGYATVALIPYTLKHTILGQRARGDKINLEFDVFAKYAYASPHTRNKQLKKTLTKS